MADKQIDVASENSSLIPLCLRFHGADWIQSASLFDSTSQSLPQRKQKKEQGDDMGE